MIDIQMITLGELRTNCYLVTDVATGKIAVVDPGAFSPHLKEFVDNHTDKIQYILLTHGHFDHIEYAEYIQNKTKAKVVISKEEEPFLNDSTLNLSIPFMGVPTPNIEADIILNDGDTLPFGNTEIRFLLTPGHTKGSGCFIIEKDIFTGDTLFRLSMGRTDFPTSNLLAMKNSLKKLAEFDDDYHIYPGHSDLSDIGYEKKYNPYLKSVI